MIGLMHPDDVVEYARERHGNILRLVEAERVLEPKPKKGLGLSGRILLKLRDFMIGVRSKPSPSEVEVACRSTSDEMGGCVV